MSGNTVIWIVVAVVVVLILLALALAAARKAAEKKREHQRGEAGDLRERAAVDERKVKTREAEAAEQEALAREARAESDRKAATADKLEMQADEGGEHASAKRAEQHERLRAADHIDPDVPDSGRREHGTDAGRREGGPGVADSTRHSDHGLSGEPHDRPGSHPVDPPSDRR